MSDATARIINITMLMMGSLETFFIATSFRKDTLRNRSDKVFFVKILTACVMMLTYGIYFYRGAENFSFSPEYMQLLIWTAKYYICDLNSVIQAFMPSSICICII